MIDVTKKIYTYKFIIPGVLVYFIFFVLPSIMGMFYSFTYWNFDSVRFAGIENFKNILTDPELSRAVKNTIQFTVFTVFFKMLFGVLLAVFLNRQLKTKNFLRSVYYFPAVLNNVAVGLAFSAILHPLGVLNGFLNSIGFTFLTKDWLTDTTLVMYSVSAIDIWKWSGFTMVLILAGLQSIPHEFYEASDIDGANWIQRFRFVTLPLIMPSFNNALVLSLIGGLKVFDIVYTVTNGGPGTSSEILNSAVYKAFSAGRLGEASAGSFLIALLVALVVISSYSFLRRKEVEL